MSIKESYRKNFEVIQRAATNGDLALVECTDKNGAIVNTICAIHLIDGEYQITPLAKLFDGNPYEELNPPV